jgi:hypothetical protein
MQTSNIHANLITVGLPSSEPSYRVGQERNKYFTLVSDFGFSYKFLPKVGGMGLQVLFLVNQRAMFNILIIMHIEEVI